jgi:predicted amidohydrolase YtcJ
VHPALFALLLTSLPAAKPETLADVIVTGGTIYTLDLARPRAAALAIRDGRFMYVGAEDETLALKGPGTIVIDATSRTVLPGLIDAHVHLATFGASLREVDLTHCRSFEEVVRSVAERAAQTPPGAWIIGRGWDDNVWHARGFPTHEELSRAVPSHPVALYRVDGHALLVNAQAMKLAGLTASSRDPDGGRILRDAASGDPTGVVIDRAAQIVTSIIPAPTPDQIRQDVLAAQRQLHRVGITSVHEAGASRAEIEVYESMARMGQLSVRAYVMVRGREPDLAYYLAKGPRINVDGHEHLTVRALKLFADGSLNSRSAALLQPYSDEPDNSGLVILSHQEIRDIAARALQAGFQVCAHAIGDRANRTVLDAYADALRAFPATDHRFRIEHASVISREDVKRLAGLGVIPSVQTAFVPSDAGWLERRLGWTRLNDTYAWRALLDAGVVLAGGSDVPFEVPSPIRSFHAALTRQDASGWPTGGFAPAQRISREAALAHITVWPAFAAFQDRLVGSISPGRLADLAILSQDIMTIAPERILETMIDKTIVGGEVVYDRARETPVRTSDRRP